jgi:LysM repeat protein
MPGSGPVAPGWKPQTSEPQLSDSVVEAPEGSEPGLAAQPDEFVDAMRFEPAVPIDADSGSLPAPDDDADLEPPAAVEVAAVGAAPAQGDWLDSICPYLVSDDGAYRSAQPDGSHRCAAQEPSATLPMAFQERFCLTSRHVRCEMYKYAQQTNPAGGIPADQLHGAGAAATVRSVAVASSNSGPRRPAFVAAAAIGGVVIVVFVLALLLGSCSGEPAGVTPGESASPAVGASAEPTPEPTPQPTPGPTPEPTPEPDPDRTDAPEATPAPEADEREVLYEVQVDEKLLRIAEAFGVSRRRIIRANEGMADKQPYVAPGQVIVVPVPASMSIEELEAIPGYQGPAG